jgi:NAD(P)-dependent dehydrogenase (short-subunit alcohol dehydrogenase family)
MEEADFEAVLDVHLRGSFHVTRAAFPHLRAQGYGRIVMTTSPAGLYGNFGQANYAAAKAGVVGLARALAHEGARVGIRTNVVAPAAFTRLLAGNFEEGKVPPLPVELVAPVVTFLCHESCELNGQILSAGGGRVGGVVIEESRGYFSSTLTAEELADNLEAVFDRDIAMLPTGLADTAGWLREMLSGP